MTAPTTAEAIIEFPLTSEFVGAVLIPMLVAPGGVAAGHCATPPAVPTWRGDPHEETG